MSKLIQLGRTVGKISGTICAGISRSHPGVCSAPLSRFSSSSSSTTPFPPGSGPVDATTSNEPWIPPYEQREGEPVETIRARLLYQSRKRGMLENGILLSTFAAKFLDSMGEAELKEYDRLINLPSNDWDLYYWATGVKPIPSEFDTPVLHKFIDHVRNANREQRFKQPDLN